MFCYPKKKWLTLGARDFSCAVSDFGQKKRLQYLGRDIKHPAAREKKLLVPRIEVAWLPHQLGAEAPYNVQGTSKR